MKKFGYAASLSTEYMFAGGSYLDVDDIIFEEFISRTYYLPEEPAKLMNFYCTVDRKRGTTRLWLAGNTISRACPYFAEWELDKILKGMKQGDMRTLEIKTGFQLENSIEEIVKIAIEYCKSTGRSSHTIGSHSKMMNSGEWQTDPQPHLPESIKNYRFIYKIGFQFQNFKFIADFMQNKKNKQSLIWYIYPYYKEWKDNIIIISDVISPKRNWQRDIYNISIKNKKIQEILYTFRENQIFYSSDLCRNRL